MSIRTCLCYLQFMAYSENWSLTVIRHARTLVLTNCTNRKRAARECDRTIRDVASGGLARVATDWGRLLGGPREKAPAREVYCGRSFTEALAATAHAWRRTAGGVSWPWPCARDTNIPNYSATISPGSEDSILAKMSGETASAWWDALVGKSRFSRRPDGGEFERIWVALSGPYLDMVKHTTRGWVSEGLEGLRIFSKHTVLPEELVPFAPAL